MRFAENYARQKPEKERKLMDLGQECLVKQDAELLKDVVQKEELN